MERVVQNSLPPLLQSPSTYSHASSSSASATPIPNNTWLCLTKNRQLSSRRGPENYLSMSSLLLIIMLLSLSLAIGFCEGRTASFLQSKKDIVKVKVKNPSSLTSMTDIEEDKRYRVMAVGVKSIDHTSHSKEDNNRRENSSTYVQKRDLIAVSVHEPPPHNISEEKPAFHLDYAGPRIHPPSHN